MDSLYNLTVGIVLNWSMLNIMGKNYPSVNLSSIFVFINKLITLHEMFLPVNQKTRKVWKSLKHYAFKMHTQQTFNCSKSTIETLEESVKYVQS